MIRELIERTMEVKDGERRFSPELRKAYFGNLGIKPPAYDEMIERAGLREEIGRFRVDLDLLITPRGRGITMRPRIAAAFMDDPAEALFLVDEMNDPANLARANRVLSESGQIRDMAIVSGAVAAGYLATLATHL